MREPVLVFDIETVPDIAGARRIHGFEGLDDAAAAQALAARRLAEKGTDFQPLHLHRIVAISCCLRHGSEFRIWSLGEPDEPEQRLVQRFFDGIEKYRPTLVSWNGGGFDLPVLHYRALLHGVASPRYWDTGQIERDSRWDNYLGRYQFRHTDLMDVLALYQPRAYAPLHEVALLLGLPGKLGMEGGAVAAAFQGGRIGAIRAYCEADVLNTYLIFLRFQRLRGALSLDEYGQEVLRVRNFLGSATAPHWGEFLAAWNAAESR